MPCRRPGGVVRRLGPWIADLKADTPVLGAVRSGGPLVAALGASGGLGWLASRRHRRWSAPLLALTLWVAWFFRDPPRRCARQRDLLYAPADGTITAVDEVDWDWFIHGRALRIVTFLTLLDVHVTRSPVGGRLVASRRDRGGHAPAFLVRGADRNARLLLGIVRGPAPGDRVVLAQVVGFLARRIVPWRHPGDSLSAGQKVGLMRFGSRADVLVPAGQATPLVAPGDRVRAGLTPIARYHHQAGTSISAVAWTTTPLGAHTSGAECGHQGNGQ